MRRRSDPETYGARLSPFEIWAMVIGYVVLVVILLFASGSIGRPG